jgi:hypothetical protein
VNVQKLGNAQGRGREKVPISSLYQQSPAELRTAMMGLRLKGIVSTTPRPSFMLSLMKMAMVQLKVVEADMLSGPAIHFEASAGAFDKAASVSFA